MITLRELLTWGSKKNIKDSVAMKTADITKVLLPKMNLFQWMYFSCTIPYISESVNTLDQNSVNCYDRCCPFIQGIAASQGVKSKKKCAL